jgi:L-threonylcarbamoyladenylate synthase
MSVGGVAVFPSDTVYGLACDAQNRLAVERLYKLKRRRLDKPSAVMFFDLELALAALGDLGPGLRTALARLLPGPVTVLLPNLGLRFPLACGDDPLTLGLRVPFVPVGLRLDASRTCPIRSASAPTCSSTAVSSPGPPPPWSTCAAMRMTGGGA